MKTRILASIITGVLATSAAQASSSFSTNELDTIYSGLNPSFTRNVDVTSYYSVPAQLQLGAGNKSTCSWRVGKNDTNAAYTVPGNNEYFAPAELKLVC